MFFFLFLMLSVVMMCAFTLSYKKRKIQIHKRFNKIIFLKIMIIWRKNILKVTGWNLVEYFFKIIFLWFFLNNLNVFEIQTSLQYFENKYVLNTLIYSTYRFVWTLHIWKKIKSISDQSVKSTNGKQLV